MRQAAEYERLQLHGVVSRAHVRGLRTLERLRSAGEGDVEIELELELEWEGGRRDVVHRQVVSWVAMRSLCLGASVAVRVDPDDPSRVAIA